MQGLIRVAPRPLLAMAVGPIQILPLVQVPVRATRDTTVQEPPAQYVLRVLSVLVGPPKIHATLGITARLGRVCAVCVWLVLTLSVLRRLSALTVQQARTALYLGPAHVLCVILERMHQKARAPCAISAALAATPQQGVR